MYNTFTFTPWRVQEHEEILSNEGYARELRLSHCFLCGLYGNQDCALEVPGCHKPLTFTLRRLEKT